MPGGSNAGHAAPKTSEVCRPPHRASTPATPTIAGPEGRHPAAGNHRFAHNSPDHVVIQVGDIKLTAGQVDLILQAYTENQRMYANGPGRNQFIEQVVRVLLLSEEGKRRKLTETEAYKNQVMYSVAGILASHTDEDIKRSTRGDEALLKAYYEAHKSDYEQIRARHILIRMQGSPSPCPPGRKTSPKLRRRQSPGNPPEDRGRQGFRRPGARRIQ